MIIASTTLSFLCCLNPRLWPMSALQRGLISLKLAASAKSAHGFPDQVLDHEDDSPSR